MPRNQFPLQASQFDFLSNKLSTNGVFWPKQVKLILPWNTQNKTAYLDYYNCQTSFEPGNSDFADQICRPKIFLVQNRPNENPHQIQHN